MELKGGDSLTRNGRQSEEVANQGGKKSDDNAENGERHSYDEIGAVISKEDGDSAEFDPVAGAIFKLQSVLEEIEKEVQKVREIGDQSQEMVDEEVHEATSSTVFTPKESTEFFLHNLKRHVKSLKQDVDISESKIEEAKDVLESKETKVTKLEYQEIESEIENLFSHKLEAEFQYIAISRAVEKLKSDEFKSTLDVVRDAQSNVRMLKIQNEKSENRAEKIIVEPVSNLQKRVCEVTSCLFIQLILLVIVFVSFVLQISPPHNARVVPT